MRVCTGEGVALIAGGSSAGIRVVPARKIQAKSIVAAAALLAAIVIFRGRAWFQPFYDPTIGLYIYIGHGWLHGVLPYSGAWDYRPPWLFAFYALFIGIAGPGAGYNLLTTAALAATTVAVGMLARELDPLHAPSTAWWAAALFVILSPENDGIAGAAEVEISAFISWALYLAVRDRRAAASFAIGILCSLAVGCKLSAVPLALFAGGLALYSETAPLAKKISRLGWMAAGFAIPLAAAIAIYTYSGALTALYGATIGASLRRLGLPSTSQFLRNTVWVKRQLWLLAPQIELAVLAAFRRANLSRMATFGWIAAGIVAIVLEGEFYERQFVIFAAPVSVCPALGMMFFLRKWRPTIAGRLAFTIAIVAAGFGLHDYYETLRTVAFTAHRIVAGDRLWRPGQTERLLAEIRSLPPRHDDSLYLLEQNPMVYVLAGSPAPTRYVYSDTLLDPRLSRSAGINAEAEIVRIFQMQPELVATGNLQDFRYAKNRVALIRGILRSRYRRVHREKDFVLYELR